MSDVIVYTFGVCHCSVCAPAGMKPEDVEADANLAHPTGLDHGWKVSDEPAFKGGEANPCQCTNPNRKHYLLEC